MSENCAAHWSDVTAARTILTACGNQDEAFLAVVKSIRSMAERLIGRKNRVTA